MADDGKDLEIVRDVCTSSAELFGLEEASLLSWMLNPTFAALLHKRSQGNTDDMRSLVFASIANYADNPLACFPEDRLYWGSEVNAMDSVSIEKLGITHVLNVAGTFSDEFLPGVVKYKSVTVEDIPEAVLPLNEVLDFIDQTLASNAANRVLVHCIEGKSRSGAVVVGYFIKKNKWTLDQALSFVKKQRRAIPNEGFVEQLKTFSASLT
eukprot:TRINITY_DN8239_c0_g1_i1.p1 TRINITY_DN8239_c0_g1~~TRINITY_DN8239_c0_g1_i1.p1  ORF type:complete len:210 (-),score=58.69 TRINITY_DN8239_c0_g1_i1:185-814(-)